MGGFNLTFLGLEVRRMLRNKRTLIFTIVMPIVFFVVFGLPQKDELIDGTNRSRSGPTTWSAMAVYGAMSACASGGSMVAVERALGWSRQLRLTPLRPAAYIAIKIMTAMVLGLIPVVVVFVIGGVSGVQLPMHALDPVRARRLARRLRLRRARAVHGLSAAVGERRCRCSDRCSRCCPSSAASSTRSPDAPQILQDIAKFIPVYGVGELARAPLGGAFHWTSVLNIVTWTVVFAIGAALAFRRDTKRV